MHKRNRRLVLCFGLSWAFFDAITHFWDSAGGNLKKKPAFFLHKIIFTKMSKIDFHRAKELIESSVNEYGGKYACGDDNVQLPKIKIERKGEDTSLKFNVEAGVDLYQIVKVLAATIGEMRIKSDVSGLILTYKEGWVWFSTAYDNVVHFHKEGEWTSQEVDAVMLAYKTGNPFAEKRSPFQRLQSLGVRVYSLNCPNDCHNDMTNNSERKLKWEDLAGYESVKQEVKDTLILPLQHPEVYEQIARETRKTFENPRPKAVLFEGPPGTGKTTCAKIIASETNIPLVYLPVESIMTKWYGESERNLAEVFAACQSLGNSLLFLDEIDSLATSRENDIHEATRKILSVLLRKIDGFEASEKTILIGATNRKQDLDPALRSRFDVSICFPLPNLQERTAIFQNYAKQLTDTDLELLAKEADGLSGRNIKDVCEHSERRWASRLLRSSLPLELPFLEEYLSSLKLKRDRA